MAEYIDREVVLNILSQKNAPWDGYQKVADLRIADVVSKAAYDQVAWERHLAEVQLKSIGKSLGEKMDDVQPVKHGRWIDGDCRCVTAVCSNCNHLRLGNGAKYATRLALYCEKCGARMDGET